MTEHSYYTCDFCGKQFDDATDCDRHELEHKAEKLKGKVRFFRKSHEEMVELPISPGSVDSVMYIYCADKETWEFLSEIFDEAGYCRPNEYCEYGSKFYAYDSDNYVWYDVVQQMNKYQEILDSMSRFTEDE